MASVKTTPVTSYNDTTSDADFFNAGNVPLLSKNSTVTGHLAGDTATSLGTDKLDYYMIDVAGGSRDSSGSLSSTDTLTIGYTIPANGTGTVDINVGLEAYSDASHGSDNQSTEQLFHGLSGTGTLTIPLSSFPLSLFVDDSGHRPDDYGVKIAVATHYTGGRQFVGDYQLNISATAGSGTGGTGGSHKPVANRDVYIIPANIQTELDASNADHNYGTTGGLTANDTDSQGHSLSITSLASLGFPNGNDFQKVDFTPDHQTLSLLAKPGFTGLSIFQYSVTDNLGNVSDPISVYVAVVGAPAGTSQVFRFFDTATQDHFYTTSPAEAANIQATQPTFHFEGVPWNTPNAGANTKDVYRFFDSATNSHFLTDNAAERDHVIATLPSYHYEGVAFEAYKAAAADTVTLERFFNTVSHEHHYAGSAAEANAIRAGQVGANWVDEGASFIVHA